jgi:hypothetical protein
MTSGMALNPNDGFVALVANGASDPQQADDDAALPVFVVESVQLANGRILRIDLNTPEDIDGGPYPPPPPSWGSSRTYIFGICELEAK